MASRMTMVDRSVTGSTSPMRRTWLDHSGLGTKTLCADCRAAALAGLRVMGGDAVGCGCDATAATAGTVSAWARDAAASTIRGGAEDRSLMDPVMAALLRCGAAVLTEIQ